MRPRKYYIYYEYGEARHIIEGSVAARKVHAWGAFRTRLDAEEHAAWHNYQRRPIPSTTAQRLGNRRL